LLYFITVNYYSAELVSKLLESIRSQETCNYKLFIVNNSLSDRDIDQLANEQVEIINSPDNIGFGRACNLGLERIWQQDREATVWLINPDACLPDRAIANLHDILNTHPEISILGTFVREPNGQISFSGGQFVPQMGLIAEIKSENLERDSLSVTDWVTGCSLVLNFKQFQACPYFDPDYFLYYEDFDFCRRYAKQGHIIYISDRIQVIHQTSAITSRNLDLKIKYEISSYLLSLSKHASHLILLFRLIRIIFASCLQLFTKPKQALRKLQGVWMYCYTIYLKSTVK
jgi:N-acetylglucosaminyl-diphospho-decaprenol L-rhamnosyltransferase